MGNSASLGIVLDDGPAYRAQAGQPLRGKIVLHLAKRTRGDEPVQFVLYGKEKTVVGSGSTRAANQRQFFHVNLHLSQGSSSAADRAPGTYTFPFTVHLPTSLPSSTTFGGNIRIQYKMEARAGRLEQKQFLFVTSAPLLDDRVPVRIHPAEFPIKRAGLLSKGSVVLGASVSDTHVGRGNRFDLHLACRNESSADISKVSIKIVEHISWWVDPNSSRRRSHERVLLESDDVHLPGLDRDRKPAKEVKRRKHNQPERDQAILYEEILEVLNSGLSKITLRVPVESRDSYKGQLVHIYHTLQIKLKTPAMITNPTVTVPLRVGSPPVRQQQPPATASAPPLPPLPEGEIPIAMAVPIPANAIEASPVVASSDVIVLGGDAFVTTADLADLVPLPPPVVAPSATLENLLNEMTSSINDYDILTAKLQHPEWQRFLASLSAQDFGSIVAHVNIDSDQPRVAVLLAPHIRPRFTCQYAAVAIRNSGEWTRSNMVERLLPFCDDVRTEHQVIRAELNAWERTVTDPAFDAAGAGGSNAEGCFSA